MSDGIWEWDGQEPGVMTGADDDRGERIILTGEPDGQLGRPLGMICLNCGNTFAVVITADPPLPVDAIGEAQIAITCDECEVTSWMTVVLAD